MYLHLAYRHVWITSLSVLLVVGLKCTMAVSHADPWWVTESRWVCRRWDRQTDGQTPNRYVMLSARCGELNKRWWFDPRDVTADRFSGSGRAIGLACLWVSRCSLPGTISFELNDVWPTYLACCVILTLCPLRRSRSFVTFHCRKLKNVPSRLRMHIMMWRILWMYVTPWRVFGCRVLCAKVVGATSSKAQLGNLFIFRYKSFPLLCTPGLIMAAFIDWFPIFYYNKFLYCFSACFSLIFTRATLCYRGICYLSVCLSVSLSVPSAYSP